MRSYETMLKYKFKMLVRLARESLYQWQQVRARQQRMDTCITLG